MSFNHDYAFIKSLNTNCHQNSTFQSNATLIEVYLFIIIIIILLPI